MMRTVADSILYVILHFCWRCWQSVLPFTHGIFRFKKLATVSYCKVLKIRKKKANNLITWTCLILMRILWIICHWRNPDLNKIVSLPQKWPRYSKICSPVGNKSKDKKSKINFLKNQSNNNNKNKDNKKRGKDNNNRNKANNKKSNNSWQKSENTWRSAYKK